MAGDLEEFLKRAAERRAQKQQGSGGKQAVAGKPRSKPEYTDSRRERMNRTPAEDPIPVAELVDSDSYIDPLAEQRARLEQAKRRAEEARAKYGDAKPSSGGPILLGDSAGASEAQSPAEELINMLRRPGGAQQAFLLKEILDRPEDRWG